MMGTIIGFIMMLSGFDSLDIQNITSVQALLTQLGGSMATALYTTIVGLVCGSVLKLQFFLIAIELDKLENKI
jgi:biopolymer transport protein ExbB/TolQ